MGLLVPKRALPMCDCVGKLVVKVVKVEIVIVVRNISNGSWKPT